MQIEAVRVNSSIRGKNIGQQMIEFINWGTRNVLSMQIETKLHKRKCAAVTNFDKKLPLPQSDLAQSTLKTPYLFDFLSLGDKAQKSEIEKGLVKRYFYKYNGFR